MWEGLGSPGLLSALSAASRIFSEITGSATERISFPRELQVFQWPRESALPQSGRPGSRRWG